MRRALLVLLLVVPLAAVGCGKSAKEHRQDFLAKGIGICSHFSTLQNEVRFPMGNPLAAKTSHVQRAQWGLALTQIVNFGRQEVRGLRKLKAPKDLRDRFEQMLDTKEAAFDDLAKSADAAKRNHTAEIKAPADAGRAKLSQAGMLAKAVGLPKCA
jgi:hypothetical protein